MISNFVQVPLKSLIYIIWNTCLLTNSTVCVNIATYNLHLFYFLIRYDKGCFNKTQIDPSVKKTLTSTSVVKCQQECSMAHYTFFGLQVCVLFSDSFLCCKFWFYWVGLKIQNLQHDISAKNKYKSFFLIYNALNSVFYVNSLY